MSVRVAAVNSRPHHVRMKCMRDFPKTLVPSVSLLLAASLSGCGGGGGGGGGGPPTPVNSPPTVSGVNLSTIEDQTGTATLTATDANGDALTASISTQP